MLAIIRTSPAAHDPNIHILARIIARISSAFHGSVRPVEPVAHDAVRSTELPTWLNNEVREVEDVRRGRAAIE
jgi:hypothetical protein